MLLTPTDLPEPVVPATSKWGILAKSTTNGSPVMRLPKHKGKSALDLAKSCEPKSSEIRTSCRRGLGTSMPM